MAFPVVESRATGSTTTNATNHTITFPSSIVAGELLLAFVSTDGSTTTSVADLQGRWTKIGGQQRNSNIVSGVVFAKIAEASGSLDNLTVVTSSQMVSWVTMRVSGHGGLPTGTGTNGSSTNSDPPAHTPAWGTQDYLWIAARMGDSNVAATAAPTNYSNLTGVAHSDSTNGASVHTAERSLNGSTENPGTFTSATEQWATFTIAVPPSSAAIPKLVASYMFLNATAGTSSLVTPSFTPAANEVIVVKAGTSNTPTVVGTPTGGSLTYTRRSSTTSGSFSYTVLDTAQVGSSPSSMTVTVPFSGTNGLRSMVVERWQNATLAGTPAVNSTKTGSGAPSATVTTTSANSVVTWFNTDWNVVDPDPYTYRGDVNETDLSSIYDGSNGFNHYAAYQGAASAASQTIGLTAPTGQAWSIHGIEVKYQSPGITGTATFAGAGALTSAASLTTLPGATFAGAGLLDATASSYNPSAVTFVNAAQATGADGVAAVCNKPSGTAEGDFMIAAHTIDRDGTLASMTASGWTQIYGATLSTGPALKIWQKWAESSEPSTYTFGTDAAGESDVGVGIVSLRGVDPTTPLSVSPTASTTTTTSTSHTAPSVTGITNGVLITAHAGDGGSDAVRTYTPPTGMTERVDTGGSSYVCLEVNTLALTSNAATGAQTPTLSPNTAIRFRAVSLVVQPITVPSQAGAATLAGAGALTSAASATTLPGSTFSGTGSLAATGIGPDALNVPFTDSGGLTGYYHVYSSGLPRNGTAGLVVHFHGDGAHEHTYPTENYCFAGNRGLVATSKAKGYIFVSAKTPDTATDLTWWVNGPRNSDYFAELLDNLVSTYQIDRSKIWLSGYSGGAEFISLYFTPQYGAAKITGGGAMIVGGGTSPSGVTTPVGWTSEFKAAFPMTWITGGQDDGTYAGDGFNALAAATGGSSYYSGQGFTTTLVTPPSVGHELDGAFGPMLDDLLPTLSGYTVPSRTPGSTRPSLITSYLVTGTATATTTTTSFTPSANETIVVKCWAADYGSPNIDQIVGGDLTYATKAHIQATSKSEAWIFVAEVGATSPGAMTVSVSWFGTSGDHGMVVERWSNARVKGIPAQGSTVMGSGAPSVSVTPTTTVSIISWINADWNVTSGTATYRSSATQTQTSATTGVRAYAAYQAPSATTAQTVGLSAPTGQAWSLGAIELLPAPDPIVLATATFAGSGGFTSNATLGAIHPGNAVLAGVGSLSVAGTTVSPAQTTFSGAGALSGTATRSQFAQSTFAGTGDLIAGATKIVLASASMAGAGALTGSATLSRLAEATFSGAGALTSTTSGTTLPTSTFAGAGSCTASAVRTVLAQASFSGIGALNTTSVRVQPGSAAFAGAGLLGAGPLAVAVVGAAFGGTGALVSAGSGTALSTVAFGGAGALSATGVRAVLAQASFAGAGAFSAAGQAATSVAVSLTGIGGMIASSAPVQIAAATFAGAGSLAATSSVTVLVAASFAGAGALSAAGIATAFSATSFAGTGVLTAGGTLVRLADAVLAGAGSFTATGLLIRLASTSLTGTGAFTVGGIATQYASVSFTGAGLLTSSSGGVSSAAASLAGTSTLSGTPFSVATTTAILSGSGAVVVAGQNTVLVSATLAGAAALSAGATRVALGSAILTGSGALIATGGKFAILEGSGALTGVAVRLVVAQVSLSGAGSISTLSQLFTAAELAATSHLGASGGYGLGIQLRGRAEASFTAVRLLRAAAILAGTGSLQSTAHRRYAGAAALSGAGALLTGLVRVRPTVLVLAGTGQMSAGARATVPGTIVLRSAGWMTLGTPARLISASLSAQGRLQIVTPARAALAAVGGFSATAQRLNPLAAALAAHGALISSAATRPTVWTRIALIAQSSLTTGATPVKATAATLSGQSSWTARVRELHATLATLWASGALSATAYPARPGESVDFPTAPPRFGVGHAPPAGSFTVTRGNAGVMHHQFVVRRDV